MKPKRFQKLGKTTPRSRKIETGRTTRTQSERQTRRETYILECFTFRLNHTDKESEGDGRYAGSPY